MNQAKTPFRLSGAQRAFGGVLVLLALPLAACHRPEAPAEPVRPALTVVLGAAAPVEQATYTGEVRSRYESPLGFRVGGKIAERKVDVGSRVKAGDVLMRLDPADTELSAAAARAQLDLAEADLKRYRELRAKNFVSQALLDAKETAYKASRAQADLAHNQSAYTVLRADQAGVVAQVAGEVGQVVAAGTPVVRIARTDALEVAIAIPEARIQAVRGRQAAKVSLWAAGGEARATTYDASLREISAVADAATRTYAARVAIAKPDDGVLLGMTANVRFLDAPADARSDGATLSVPLTAIFQQDGKPALWVVGGDQTVALRPVQVKAYGESAALLGDGVKAGERVVVAGVHKLTSGEKIRPVDQPATMVKTAVNP